MSAAWSRYIRENVEPRKLSHAARYLLEVLGHFGNSDGVAYPSTATLMDRMCMSEPTIKRARRELAVAGVLVVTPGDGRRPTTYVLPSAALRGVADDPPRYAQGGHHARGGGSPRARRGVTGDPRSTNRSAIGSARAGWCDETCPLCHGVGWIEQRAANGDDPINVAEPCPHRQ